MEQIVFKEQLQNCKCPFCTREFVIVKDIMPQAKQEAKSEIKAKAKPVKVKMKTHKAWSQEDDNALRNMAAQGMKTKHIAAKLGRTLNTVYVRKGKLGLCVNPQKPQQNENETALEVQGLNTQELLERC
jgi:hypothetical protein